MVNSLSSKRVAPLSLIFAIALVGSQGPMADELSYATLTSELKDYCVAEVCLGQTIAEVSKRGKLSFSDFGLPDGKLICNPEFGNIAHGDFIAKDSRAFAVIFALVSTKGEPESRYRLMHVKILLPQISELQIDHLRETLTNRYNLRKIGESELNMWTGKTRSGLFSITAMKWWAKPEVPLHESEKIKALSLDARLFRKKEWLMKQPQCQSGLPKI